MSVSNELMSLVHSCEASMIPKMFRSSNGQELFETRDSRSLEICDKVHCNKEFFEESTLDSASILCNDMSRFGDKA